MVLYGCRGPVNHLPDLGDGERHQQDHECRDAEPFVHAEGPAYAPVGQNAHERDGSEQLSHAHCGASGSW